MSTTSHLMDLEFHLRELRSDLERLNREVVALAPLVAAGSAWALSNALGTMCGGIEHAYTTHSASALDLSRPSAPRPESCARRPEEEFLRDSDERWSRAEDLMPDVRSAERLLLELRAELEGLSASLSDASAHQERTEKQDPRGAAGPGPVESLLERVHASLGDAMRFAFLAMQKATWLYRLTDPDAWQAEKDERERHDPFQIEICDKSGHIFAVAEITETSWRHLRGRLIREDMPPALRSALQEYHELIEAQVLSLLDEAQAKVRAWDLQVVGIPERTSSARLTDFQLNPDGVFALEVE
jgi:hypothetical protein